MIVQTESAIGNSPAQGQAAQAGVNNDVHLDSTTEPPTSNKKLTPPKTNSNNASDGTQMLLLLLLFAYIKPITVNNK